MGCGTGPFRVIAALALLAGAIGVAPSAARADDVSAPAAPPVQSASALASSVTAAAQALTDLRAHQVDLTAQLASASADADRLAQSVTAAQRSASALVATARQEAIESYMQADPASEPFALANALAQGDANDVAWSIGLLKVTHQQSIDRLRQAETARGDAQTDLTAALAHRAAVQAELAESADAITRQQATVAQAQAALETYVRQAAPATVAGMTTVAYAAYTKAAARVAAEQPACGLRWELLGAIGKTESNHGSGRIDVAGDSVVSILGIPIGPDTDGGAFDGDPARDHAVGPMQFIPATWRTWGADGNGDGKPDPGNIFDATLAAGRYLCTAAGPLTLLNRDGVVKAILAYNPNLAYLQIVGARFEALAEDVAHGWFTTGDLPNAVPAGSGDADGGTPPSDAAPPAPPATQVHTLTFFSGGGVVIQTAGDVVTGTCAAPSGLLAPRTGFAHCVPADGSPTLDPSAVSPSDPTLLACVSDPTQPARLVRSSVAVAAGPLSPAPPFVALQLSGGDLCKPSAPVPAGAGTSLALGPRAAPTSTTGATTTTTTATTTTTTTATTTTTTGRRGSSTTSSSTPSPAPTTSTTTSAPTTVASTTTTAPAPTTTTVVAAPTPPGASYVCASGATVVGQPDTASPVWQALVSQPGVAPRPVPVDAAWS